MRRTLVASAHVTSIWPDTLAKDAQHSSATHLCSLVTCRDCAFSFDRSPLLIGNDIVDMLQ